MRERGPTTSHRSHASVDAGGDPGVYDVIGIGFGPANLSLAVALEEEAERPAGTDLRRLFLEARPDQCWHPGMLLEDSLIQITVLKDLILPVNPRSRFTFLNYLKERDRLFQFLNLRDLFPSRTEFNDYLCWVAGQLSEHVRYHRRVRTVRALEPRDGEVELVEVVATDEETGREERFLARNVVVATGGRPWVPPETGFSLDRASDRAFHAHEFMLRMDRGFPDRTAPHRFVVVGSGQSGAEIFYCLLRRYPEAEVTATLRGFGYRPADESDFVNEVFLPEMVDFFYELPADRRQGVVDSFRDVNYSVVDHPLIKKIYRALYDESVIGKKRARVLPYKQLLDVEERDGEVCLRLRDLIQGDERELRCDGLVLCTGYRWDNRHPLLDELTPWLREEEGGSGYRVLRDYRLEARPGFAPGVYFQGYCEATHGISETVLSLLPVRAHDILRSVLDRAAGVPEVPVAAVVGVEG